MKSVEMTAVGPPFTIFGSAATAPKASHAAFISGKVHSSSPRVHFS
ncbi:hypothetical protein [Actinomyces culturomici]|nr:hypothetical protein [Actinomyces culturomici]